MMRNILILYLFLFSNLCLAQNNKVPLADQIQWLGHAISEEDYHIWGTSPIMDEQGKVHLFVARWPKETTHFGWKTHSQIAHYVSDRPEGPFKFVEVVLEGSGGNTWDEFAPHNPAIQKVGNRYALFYIANSGLEKHPSNQCIGLLLSESLYGPWEKAGKDGRILAPPKNRSFFNYQAGNGVVNPALLQKDGKFYLYFKSNDTRKDRDWRPKMGLAIADKIEGPYVQLKDPITQNEQVIEDGYAFECNKKVYLLTTDNHGMLQEGGGLLWSSDDGLYFSKVESGFGLFTKYLPSDYPLNPKYVKGSLPKLERPQVLMIDGKPAYLYMPSQCNIDGKEVSESYVFKIDWVR